MTFWWCSEVINKAIDTWLEKALLASFAAVWSRWRAQLTEWTRGIPRVRYRWAIAASAARCRAQPVAAGPETSSIVWPTKDYWVPVNYKIIKLLFIVTQFTNITCYVRLGGELEFNLVRT